MDDVITLGRMRLIFKNQYAILIVSLSITLLALLSASFAVGFPHLSMDCSTSGCHEDSTGMEITIDSTTFEVSINEVFSLNVSAVGQVCKFPRDVANNSDFIYGTLDNEGRVDDGDVADLDPDIGMIQVYYSISAPSTPGSYSLRLFAATHTPSGASVQIDVNVIDPYASSTTSSNTSSSTTPPPTSPSTPINPRLVILDMLLSVLHPNLLFTWGFLSLFLLAIMYLTARDKPKPRIIIPGTIILAFGWAAIIQSGYRFNPIAILITFSGFALLWYAEVQARRIMKRQGKN